MIIVDKERLVKDGMFVESKKKPAAYQQAFWGTWIAVCIN